MAVTSTALKRMPSGFPVEIVDKEVACRPIGEPIGARFPYPFPAKSGPNKPVPLLTDSPKRQRTPEGTFDAPVDVAQRRQLGPPLPLERAVCYALADPHGRTRSGIASPIHPCRQNP
ncbi:hypothetical protein [uncultured Jannaschia sp.]|uniref:hypothetical protein n=1 Tax=uncultured Jannaschia sp. TaxID=293347 RepID=UPI002615E230|nr:hypothetical protein [uncultured Jannaschia sp.]